MTGERVHAASAYLVFVALDDEGKPRPVAPTVAETVVEQRRGREAAIRRQTRMEHRDAIRKDRREVGSAEATSPGVPGEASAGADTATRLRS